MASPRGEAYSKQPQTGLSLLFLSVFGTGTPSTGTSEALPRDEGDIYRHFGTVTLPTGTSETSPRGHCELVYRIVAILGFVKFTWHELLLIIK